LTAAVISALPQACRGVARRNILIANADFGC
jgi:hypothetical protein